jgi:hypothetical protein
MVLDFVTRKELARRGHAFQKPELALASGTSGSTGEIKPLPKSDTSTLQDFDGSAKPD